MILALCGHNLDFDFGASYKRQNIIVRFGAEFEEKSLEYDFEDFSSESR